MSIKRALRKRSTDADIARFSSPRWVDQIAF